MQASRLIMLIKWPIILEEMIFHFFPDYRDIIFI